MAFLGRWFGFGREELFEQAMRAYDRGDWECAAERFEACLDGADPAMARLSRFYMGESYAQLGRSMVVRGDDESAAINLRKALDISPRYPDLHVAIARVYGRLGNNALRAEEIRLALDLNANFVDALFEKGLLAYDEGRHDEGVDQMTKAVEADPMVNPSIYEEGLEALRRGDRGAARSYFACALANDSDAGRLHLCLAGNFHRERMFDEAAEQYRMASELMPRYADVFCRYGQVLLELGRIQDAVKALRRAVEINSRYVQAHAYLGVALLRSRQDEQAKAEVETALTLDPANPVALSAARRLRIA